VKCVLVDLANGEGGVYARKVGTGYKGFSGSVKVGHRFGDDVHWTGGDPVGNGGAGAIYGYASANGTKGVVTLRNSSDKPLAFAECLAKLLDLSASEFGAVVKSQRTVYSHDAEIGNVAHVSDVFSISLAPHAMAVVEFDFGQ